MASTKCWVFAPSDERPQKRRRIQLDKGRRDPDFQRRETYQKAWRQTQARVNAGIDKIHQRLVHRIQRFVEESASARLASKIPTGFVVTGPGSISHHQLFDRIRKNSQRQQQSMVISLTAADGVNLKTLLKTIIKAAVQSPSEFEANENDRIGYQGNDKLLNYDLRTLHELVRHRKIGHIVLGFQDCEAFDIIALADALQLLHLWLDRVPLVLLFGISTSLETFQERLPSSAARIIAGECFSVARRNDILSVAFEHSFGEQSPLQIGPALTEIVLTRHTDQLGGIEEFLCWIKYIYMCHYFGNPLSTILNYDVQFKALSPNQFEAIRNLASFRRLVEDLVEHGEAGRARRILSSDETLFEEILKGISAGREAFARLFGTIRIVQILQSALGKPVTSYPSLYAKALSGDLRPSSPLIRELLLFVKKITPAALVQTVGAMIDILICLPASEDGVSPDDFRDVQNELLDLAAEKSRGGEHPITEKDGPQTATRQVKVGESTIAECWQENYSQIVATFHDILEDFFNYSLTTYRTLFLHEVLVYDLRSPYRDVFAPKPRFALERALSSPHDYLGCVCCKESNGLHLATQPPTAILYQLYLESGALINVFDLFSAFQTMMDEGNRHDRLDMALFFRALSELKRMGYIKQSRKRTDHVAKLEWFGL